MSKSTAEPLSADLFTIAFFVAMEDMERHARTDGNSDDKTANDRLDELFGEDPALKPAFIKRLSALAEIFDHPDLAPWKVPNPDDPERLRIHPALLTAAATVKLNKNGQFPRRRLLDHVAEVAAKEFPDWPD